MRRTAEGFIRAVPEGRLRRQNLGIRTSAKAIFRCIGELIPVLKKVRRQRAKYMAQKCGDYNREGAEPPSDRTQLKN
ncbi:MAG: hypothetical protein C5B58_03110 [Acidobacteria bacterium]|nr:MAG: hypothetical protein C5B58_03110 [Acidobacteriota bacterium]